MQSLLFWDIFLAFNPALLALLMPNAATRWAQRAQNNPKILELCFCFLPKTQLQPHFCLFVCLKLHQSCSASYLQIL